MSEREFLPSADLFCKAFFAIANREETEAICGPAEAYIGEGGFDTMSQNGEKVGGILYCVVFLVYKYIALFIV